MASVKPDFSVGAQPEVFFTGTAISDAVRYAVRSGRARKLGPRLYTRNVDDPLEAVARRNWAAIAAGYLPGAVIVGRTAFAFAHAAARSRVRCAAPSWRMRSRSTVGSTRAA